MASFQERVVAEKEELDGRLVRLRSFMSGDVMVTLPLGEQSRLRRQRSIMENYSEVLCERIEAFDTSYNRGGMAEC